MPNPFEAAGAEHEASKYAPLTMDRYITGLATNRNPLRDADVPYLQSKFYAAGRTDSIWDGLNIEVSAKLSLIRRPGNSPYNTNLFPPVKRFYEFRTVVDGSNILHVMADCAATVYDATGPSTQLAVWQKSAGAGATCFQSVGNTLYFANKNENKKWLQAAKAWKAARTFNAGDWIVDTNNNIQLIQQQTILQIASITIAANIVTVQLQSPDSFLPGANVVMAGLTAAPFLNGVTLVPNAIPIANGFQAPFTHANYALAADTGTATTGSATLTTGAQQPAWSTVRGALTNDGNGQWYCWGSSVQNWGIASPTVAPSAAQANLPTNAYQGWTANTVYSNAFNIVDSNGNIQSLTTGGITGSAAPTWATVAGNTTADGTAVWTCMGSATRMASTAYALRAIVSVTFTYYITVFVPGYGGYGDGGNTQGGSYRQVAVTETDFFLCTTAGITGPNAPGWGSGFGTTVADGTVVWTNQGSSQTWPTNVGATTNLSLATKIVDSNGNFQTVAFSGKSGATVPVWSTTLGANTTDNGLIWTEGGPYSAANTAAQLWGYAYKNSIDDDTTSMSPPSIAVTIGADKYGAIQGPCSTDPQTDTIVIYRTEQGGSIFFQLDEIPQPLTGATWSYQDTSPDSALVIELQAALNATNEPPPVGIQALAYHMTRIWAAVGNIVQWCTGPDATVGNGNTAWTASNYFGYPDSVIRLVPVTLTNGALFAFSVSDMYAVFGTGTSANPFYDSLYGQGIGLLNHDALDIVGSTIHLFTTARKQISLDPSAGYTETGFFIGDQFTEVTTGGIEATLYDPTTTYVTWHESETNDTGLYVSDGAVGWFRYSPISVPESGFLWSPRAAIVGGTSAVQSIETAPGLKSLLIGPAAGMGLILKRDLTLNSDDGTPYADTYVAIGSIQLCQPFEVAEVAGIALDSIRVGTAPVVGLLLGEIDPTVQVPWDMLEITGNDPPLLPPSQTLFNDRFIALQNGVAPLCRHMQLLIQWASEDAASELLTHTVYGAKWSERKEQ